MTREAIGSDLGPVIELGSGEFDLGELRPEPTAAPRLPRRPLRERLQGRSWRSPAGALVVVLVTAALAWQGGSQRARDHLTALSHAKPAVFAWVVYSGPDVTSTPKDPRATAELSVANVGLEPLQVNGLSLFGAPGVSTALKPDAPVRIPAGQTRSIGVDVRADCEGDHSDAGALVTIAYYANGESGRLSTSTELTVDGDNSLGTSVAQLLDQLCTNSTLASQDGSLDGILIDAAKDPNGATLLLSNESSRTRHLRITYGSSDSFAMDPATVGPWTLPAGQQMTAHLRIGVTSCPPSDPANWVYSVMLVVASDGAAVSNSGAGSGAAQVDQVTLGDRLLFPLGALVQRTCH